MDDKNKAVISAIMQLSNNLHFKTVSEGVETDEQVEFIKEQGGKYVQGYYFYKPLPPEEFEGLLKFQQKRFPVLIKGRIIIMCMRFKYHHMLLTARFFTVFGHN
jgi:hypothetical protein